MLRVVVFGAVSLCTVVLHGCGEDPAPAPTPAPTSPVTINIINASFDILDAGVVATRVGEPSFGRYRDATGPTWLKSDSVWVFSDTSNAIMWSYNPATSEVAQFRNQTGDVVGSALDKDGNLLMCEEVGRRVSIRAANGDVTTLVDMANGSELVAPTDIVVSSTGVIYFTDRNPNTPNSNRMLGHVVRVVPNGITPEVVIQPNVRLLDTAGIALNVDETVLYVVDQDPAHIGLICAYPLDANGDIASRCVGDAFFGTFGRGVRGIDIDSMDNIWISSDKGVEVVRPDKTKVAEILYEDGASNVAFGGTDGKTLMMTAYDSVWTIPTKVTSPQRRVELEV